MLWRRPDSIPVGRIWSRFQGRNGIGQPAMFQVRDLEDKYTSQCLAMMETIFMREEPLSKRLNLKSDRTSINAIIDDWQKYIDQRVSLVCFREEDEEPAELVGFNVVKVKSRGDVEDLGKVEGECWQKIVKVLDATESLADVFKHFGVDKYLTSNGLTVMPQFRGQNIGAKIFEARKPICKAFKLQATATVFTAVSSQVLATKCGFEVLGELPYSVMKSQGVDLDGCETGSAKLMGRKFR